MKVGSRRRLAIGGDQFRAAEGQAIDGIDLDRIDDPARGKRART